MGRITTRNIGNRVKNSPVGSIINVNPSDMSLVRYHARGCREIKSRSDLATGKQRVLLGNFFAGVKP